jgi:UDP-N-acetylglucosamine:LPS N-acetylglucosamine transferase
LYIFLSGGKTMGHITPLICLNNELKNSYEIVYFGLKDSMEEEVCKRNNITFFQMELYPFYRKKIWKNIKTFYRIFVEKK